MCLQRSGYTNVELTYTPAATKPQSKRKRTRNILWYNPPWSDNVATNIGRKFFGLLERHYPDGHRYRKFTNRNYVKVSYSLSLYGEHEIDHQKDRYSIHKCSFTTERYRTATYIVPEDLGTEGVQH